MRWQIIGEDDDCGLIFKGGTALRFCYFDDYRYSADLDFSLGNGVDRVRGYRLIDQALIKARERLELPHLELTSDAPPRISYVGPLGHKPRTLKLDLAEDELIEETTTQPLRPLYSDQPKGRRCLVYTLEEVIAEKLRCVLQRLQCRDLFDLHQLLVLHAIRPDEAWPLFECKARHRKFDPGTFPERFAARIPEYKRRWDGELTEHVSGDLPHFEGVVRAVKRSLRPVVRL